MGLFDFFDISEDDKLILNEAIKFLRKNGLNEYCDKVEQNSSAQKTLIKLQKKVNDMNKGAESWEKLFKSEYKKMTLLDFVEGGEDVQKRNGYEEQIIKLLKLENKKVTVSDINALLKLKDYDNVKIACEKLYEEGKIEFAGNGRYYILSSDEDGEDSNDYCDVIMLPVSDEAKKKSGIRIIGAIRENTGVSLKEAKEIKDSTIPKTIKNYITKTEAQLIKTNLEKVGLEINLKEIKKTKSSTSPKSETIDVKTELKKYKDMLDEGLITQEQYDAKSNKLLGL